MPKELRQSMHYGRAELADALGVARPVSTWTADEDEVLIGARASGLQWQPIARRHFPKKTPNACRKRHERLMERQAAEDWDGLRLEELAEAYMDLRRDVWAPLAARMGEKWQVIEAKCMEKGIRNLQAAYRSGQRKLRDDEPGDAMRLPDIPRVMYSTHHIYPPHPYHRPSLSDSSAGKLSIQSMLSPTPSTIGQ